MVGVAAEAVLREADRAGAADAANLAGSFLELPEIPELRFNLFRTSHQHDECLVGTAYLCPIAFTSLTATAARRAGKSSISVSGSPSAQFHAIVSAAEPRCFERFREIPDCGRAHLVEFLRPAA